MSFRLQRPVRIAAVTAILLLLVGGILVHRSGSPKITTTAAPSSTTPPQPADPSPLAPPQLTAADWMEKIKATPSSGRPQLMKDILAIADPALRDEVATAMATLWIQEDLDGFLAFLDALQVDEGVDSDRMRRFAAALRASFESVTGAKPLEGKLRYVADLIVEHLLATDLPAAEAWCHKFLVGTDRDTALARIAPALVATSPQRAMEVFAGLQSPLPRLTAATEMGAALARHDPSTALQWARSVTAHSERALAMDGVVSVLAPANPSLAATNFKEFLDRIQSEYVAAREADRERLRIKPADEFETQELYEEYLASGGHAMGPPDTPEADYVLKAGEAIALQLAKNDPAAALAWAESLPVSLAQAHAINGALAGWSTSAPQLALDHYQAHYAYDSSLPHAIFQQWAQVDATTAMQAVENLALAAQRSAAISGLTSGWLDSGEPTGPLVDWIGQLPPGPDRDNASLAILARTGADDPATSWRLVQEISADTARHRAAREVLSEIASTNPTEARAFLQQFSAPPSELESLDRIVALAEKSR